MLRRTGVSVPVGAVVDARAALGQVGVARRGDVQVGVRACLVKRSADVELFDRCFDLAFPRPRVPGGSGLGRGDVVAALASGDHEALDDLAAAAVDEFAGGSAAGPERYRVQRVMRALGLGAAAQAALVAQRTDGRRSEFEERLALADLRHLAAELDALVAEHVRRSAAADPLTPLRRRDLEFLSASPHELREMRRTIQPLARSLARRLGRRRRQGRRRGRIDVRRTMRASLASGGVPLDVVHVRRHPRRPDLWLLCDVSGSVAEFARFTLALLYAMHEEFPRTHAFTFVDRVDDVSDLLEHRAHDVDPFHVLARASITRGRARSDYGAAATEFLLRYGPRITSSSTVIVTGDARSNWRDPGVAAFAAIAERAKRLFLWNPEPRERWNADDSVVDELAPCFDRVEEVRTIGQLAACVEGIG
jgi:uncharacterized protein